MSRADDIAEVERSLRIAPYRHALVCAAVPPNAWTVVLFAKCDCGRDALDRLRADAYDEKEDAQ